MTKISQKCQYALRMIHELAKRRFSGPIPVSSIADAQAIPPRFLELIVKELRHAGIVKSRRGAHGGYELLADPKTLTVGEIIRMFDGPITPVDCDGCGGSRRCPLKGQCVFAETWNLARDAAASIYDATTFEELLERERKASGPKAITYHI